jgi:FkbM family methyltransferase
MALGVWEPYVRVHLHLKEDSVFVDIGAHIGYYSSRALKSIGGRGLVIAVEPDERNFEILRQNMCHLGFNNYRIFNKAVSVYPFANLVKSKIPLHSRMNHRDLQDDTTVECMTLDSLIPLVKNSLSEKGSQDVTVKIDVEGFEDEVVESGISMIRELRPRIVIEIYDFDNSRARELLEDIGYSYQALARNYYIFQMNEQVDRGSAL